MKKYLKLLPMILYPYMYLIVLVTIMLMVTFAEGNELLTTILAGGAAAVAKLGQLNSDLPFMVFCSFVVGYNVWVIVLAIRNIVDCSKGKYTAYEAAKMNMAVKGWQIPAYIFHFILGAIGFVASIWGIGFLLLAVIVDLLTIIGTGINAVGCAVSFKKEGIIPTPLAVLFAVGSFIYCVDVCIAVIYFGIARSRRKKEQLQIVTTVNN